MAAKLLLERYHQSSVSEDCPSAIGDVVPALLQPSSSYLHDLSFEILKAIDVSRCEDYLNISHDSFLNVSQDDSEPVSSDLPLNDNVLSADFQPVSATVAESCSVSRQESVSSRTFITTKAQVHASLDGTRRGCSPSLLGRKRYCTCSQSKKCESDTTLGSNASSVATVSRKDSKVKPVKTSSGLPKKAPTSESFLSLYNQGVSPYDDANAFATPKGSHVRGRKRIRGGFSQGRGSLKTSVSAASPCVASSSAAISGRAASGVGKKNKALNRLVKMSSLVFDDALLDDENAFVTQTVSQRRGQKRVCEPKSSRGGVSVKKPVHVQSPLVTSSSGDVSSDEFEFEGFEASDRASVSVTDVSGGASTVTKSDRFQATFRKCHYYNDSRSS